MGDKQIAKSKNPIHTFLFDAGIDSRKFAAIIALSFAASFMLFFYTPLDIYLNNPTPFVIGWRLMLPHLFGFFIVAFIAVFIVLLLLCHKKIVPGLFALSLALIAVLIARFALDLFTQLYSYMIAIIAAVAIIYSLLKKLLKNNSSDIFLLGILGIIFAAYVQTLFLNANMLTVGASSNHSALSASNIINLLLWGAIALLPIAVYAFVKASKKGKLENLKFEKVIVFCAVIICSMQTVGLASTALSTDLPAAIEDQPPQYVSFEPALNLSEDKNILVFMLDRLDSRFMREAFELHPHLKDVLYGFTNFENNIAEFFTTLPSTVSMLTQHYYTEGQTFAEYWDDAWSRHNVIDSLRGHGFTTNLYLDRWSTINDLSNIENRTDNIRTAPDDFRASLNSGTFATTMTRMSFGRMAPYLLKNIFLEPVTLDFGNHFVTLSYEIPSAQHFYVGPYHDRVFLDFIRDNEFTADKENGVFTFVHLNGAHAGGSDHPQDIPSLVQNFEILDRFFSAMRELDVFDSSTIIIVGDHGYQDLGLPFTVSLFIKPPGGAGALITDSETEMSNKFFAASILQAAGLSHEHLGLSFFDVIDGAPVPERRTYYLTRWWEPFVEYGAEGQMELLGYYRVSGDANNADNWVFVENSR